MKLVFSNWLWLAALTGVTIWLALAVVLLVSEEGGKRPEPYDDRKPTRWEIWEVRLHCIFWPLVLAIMFIYMLIDAFGDSYRNRVYIAKHRLKLNETQEEKENVAG